MTRLLLADLRRHAGTWTWTVAVAVVTGACVAGQFMVMRGSLDSARATADASMIEAASVVTTFIIVSVVLAAVAVLTSTSALAVVERERDHGLWRALGMRPIVLRVVVLGQLVAQRRDEVRLLRGEDRAIGDPVGIVDRSRQFRVQRHASHSGGAHEHEEHGGHPAPGARLKQTAQPQGGQDDDEDLPAVCQAKTLK